MATQEIVSRLFDVANVADADAAKLFSQLKGETVEVRAEVAVHLARLRPFLVAEVAAHLVDAVAILGKKAAYFGDKTTKDLLASAERAAAAAQRASADVGGERKMQHGKIKTEGLIYRDWDATYIVPAHLLK